jgi:serine/threonine protein kinase
MRDLRKLQHEHLLSGIAALQFGKSFILLSEWADGGDLRNFWKTNPSPKVDGLLIMHILKQFWGIIDAVRALHDGDALRTSPPPATGEEHRPDSPVQGSVSRANTSPSSGSAVPIINLDPQPPQQGPSMVTQDGHHRHGDIKPENILVTFIYVAFIYSGRIASWKIGDLGLVKRHNHKTQHRREPTSTEHFTSSYAPPEAITSDGPRSRAFDIWSLGCVMLETLLWMLYGYEGLENFWKLEVDKNRGTIFFTTTDTPSGQASSASLSPSANGRPGIAAMINIHTSSLLEKLLAQHPEGSALHDVIVLIRDRILVVRLPDGIEGPASRINANELLEEITRIVSIPESNQDYWLPNELRDGYQPRHIPITTSSASAPPQRNATYLRAPAVDQRVSVHEYASFQYSLYH